MRFFWLAAMVVAVAGCSKAGPPEIGSPEWTEVAEKSLADGEKKFRDHRLSVGSSTRSGNLEIAGLKIEPAADNWFALTAKVVNRSQVKVFTPHCAIYRAKDEHDNDLEVWGLFDGIDVGDQMKELQPGESGTIRMLVKPKLKVAKSGKLWIWTNDGDGLAEWLAEFNFPN